MALVSQRPRYSSCRASCFKYHGFRTFRDPVRFSQAACEACDVCVVTAQVPSVLY